MRARDALITVGFTDAITSAHSFAGVHGES